VTHQAGHQSRVLPSFGVPQPGRHNWSLTGPGVRSGSRLCENTKAINRDRTSYSFKTVSCAHIASAFNFEIEIKNIILVALRAFEFSHGLGHEQTHAPQQPIALFDHHVGAQQK
jgi:hypothetical protein